MERMFTKDVGKRFKKGDVRDYPPSTWVTIARNVKMKLETFSQLTATMVQRQQAVTMKRQPEADAQ